MKRNLDNFVNELLDSRKISKSYEKVIEECITELSQCLKKSPNKPTLKSVSCPLDHKEEILKYQPPNQVSIIGGFALNTAYEKKINEVDIIVEIPKECIHSKDYLNEGVLRRRAQYIQHVAANASKLTWVHRITYLYRGGHDKIPILSIYPKPDDELSTTRFLVHTCMDEQTFKLHRYHIKKNNIRKRWYFKRDAHDHLNNVANGEPNEEPLSMHYNTWVLNELTHSTNFKYLSTKFKNEESLQDGVVLLKIWMERKGLDQGYASGHFISAYVSYLLSTGELRSNMSPLEIFRITLENLGHSSLNIHGISLTNDKDDGMKKKTDEVDEMGVDGCDDDDGGGGGNDEFKPSMEDFHSCFDLVFVDATGYVNLCADMNICMYDMLRHEAGETLRLMSSSCVEKFEVIFLDEMKFICKFDHILRLQAREHIKMLSQKSIKLQNSIIDYCGNHTLACLHLIVSILRKALNKRIRIIGYLPFEDCEREVREEIDYTSLVPRCITLGLLLDPLNANLPEEKGPPANEAQVHEFQKFWGEKAEQFRYAGGDILEVVRWPRDNMADARTIVSRIVKFILNRHFSFPKDAIHITGNQLDNLLKPVEKKASSDWSIFGTGEEQHDDAIKSFDALSKTIRSLNDLPLTFNTVQGLSNIFRYTEVFPPMPSINQSDAGVFNNKLVPVNHNNCPQYLPKFEVLCMMERSSKWSDDRDVISRLKGAFYIKLAGLLKKNFNYLCLVYMDKLQVYKSPAKYVFEIRIGFTKELSLSRRVVLPGGQVRMEDTPEYTEAYKTLIVTPAYTSYLHGIQQQFNSFSSTTRLCKRWVSCQLLGGHVTDDVIELCVAYLYTSVCGPYMPPSSPMVGFIQFLHLVSTHDWKLQPIIVNFNGELKTSDYSEIESYFNKNRSALPCVFISTPIDRHSSYLVSPSPLMLHRLVLIARASLKIMESLCLDPSSTFNKNDFKQIFRPPITDYNVLIHLDLLKCSRPQLGVDFKYTSDHPPPKASTRSDEIFPLVSFDPVLLYIRDLKEVFDDYAYFFYDVYGGTYIAVAWKSSAFKKKSYDESCLKFHKIVGKSLNMEEASIVADEEAIINEFQTLGFGLITNVDVIKSIKNAS